MMRLDPTSVLFLDIETVSGVKQFSDLSETMQGLWRHKAKSALKRYNDELTDEEVSDAYTDKAGIFSEFGKICCISVGFITRDKATGKMAVRLKSFENHDEKILLEQFAELMNQHYQFPDRQYICGHNVKEFDVPYIGRRMVIHQIPLPVMFQLYGKKPWETKHLLDTMNMWKFGDYKNYTSLKLLAGALGFPSPKDDIDGSEVGRVYWEEDDLERIAIYCEKDVLATIRLLLKLLYMPDVEDDQVTFLDRQES